MAKPARLTVITSLPSIRFLKGLSLMQRYVERPQEAISTPSSSNSVKVKPEVVMQMRLAAWLALSRTGNIIVEGADSALVEFTSSMEKVRSPVDTTRITRFTPTVFSGLVAADLGDELGSDRLLRRRSSRGRPTDCNRGTGKTFF